MFLCRTRPTLGREELQARDASGSASATARAPSGRRSALKAAADTPSGPPERQRGERARAPPRTPREGVRPPPAPQRKQQRAWGGSTAWAPPAPLESVEGIESLRRGMAPRASACGARRGRRRAAPPPTAPPASLPPPAARLLLALLALLLAPRSALAAPTSYQQMGGALSSDEPFFGYSLAMSRNGRRVVVGAPSANTASRVRAYDYYMDSGAWVQRGQVIENEAVGDGNGMAVALDASGQYLATTSPGHDPSPSALNAGHARVYQFNDGTNPPSWGLLGKSIDGVASGDGMTGVALMLSSTFGIIVAVGEPGHGGAGRGRVFRLSGGSWYQMGNEMTGGSVGSAFGAVASMAASEEVVAYGAAFSNTQVSAHAGQCIKCGIVSVFAYVQATNTWVQMGDNLDGEQQYGQFGRSVSLGASGDLVAVGAPTEDGGTGSARVFQYAAGSGWAKKGNTIHGAFAAEEFGFSVALDYAGRALAVTAPAYGSLQRGVARVYSYVRIDWQQKGCDIYGELDEDYFGYAVAVDSTTATVAATAVRAELGGQMRAFTFSDTPCSDEPAPPSPFLCCRALSRRSLFESRVLLQSGPCDNLTDEEKCDNERNCHWVCDAPPPAPPPSPGTGEGCCDPEKPEFAAFCAQMNNYQQECVFHHPDCIWTCGLSPPPSAAVPPPSPNTCCFGQIPVSNPLCLPFDTMEARCTAHPECLWQCREQPPPSPSPPPPSPSPR